MQTVPIANWSLWITGTAFILCAFVAMACLSFMGLVAKGLFLPWEINRLVGVYRRRFPSSVIYRIFSISAIGTAVFAGLGLVVVLWIGFGAK